jgi:hypothetical protein
VEGVMAGKLAIKIAIATAVSALDEVLEHA